MQRDHHVDRAIHADCDEAARGHTERREVRGEDTGAPVEVGIRQLLAVELDRDVGRRPRRLSGDELVNSAIPLVGHLGVVPSLEHEEAVGGIEERERLDPRCRGVGDPGEQGHELLREASGRVAVEEVAAVFEQPLHALRDLLHVEGHVELGRPAVDLHRTHVDARDLQGRLRRLLEPEHRLKDRVVAGRARRMDRLDDLLERHVLMDEDVHRHRADPSEEVMERRRTAEVRPEHDGIRIEADRALDLCALAVRDRRPDEDLVLAAQAMKQHVPRRQQQHEEGNPFLPRERAEPPGELCRNLEAKASAGEALHLRPRPITGQLEDGQIAREKRTPERKGALEFGPLDPLALPDREVGILRRHLGER